MELEPGIARVDMALQDGNIALASPATQGKKLIAHPRRADTHKPCGGEYGDGGMVSWAGKGLEPVQEHVWAAGFYVGS